MELTCSIAAVVDVFQLHEYQHRLSGCLHQMTELELFHQFLLHGE